MIWIERPRGTWEGFTPTTKSANSISSFRLLNASTDAGTNASVFHEGVFLIEGNGIGWFGTYIDGDEYTGTAISTSFRLAEPSMFIPIIGYPNLGRNQLRLEILTEAGAPVESIGFLGDNPGERPGVWVVDATKWINSNARLVLVDAETSLRGWLGVGVPRPAGGPIWLEAVPRNIPVFAAAALALIALLFLPGLAARTWIRSFPSGSAYLAIPGIIVLSLLGLLVWVLGPVVGRSAVTIFLATYIIVTAALAQHWWKKGSPILASEWRELCVYVSVILSSLAFAIAPVDVAQEYDARSTAQARMIASPPDHGIPYRTAVYMYHGKTGQEDRVVYFGTDWSITSRGPLVPLMIVGAFMVFDIRPPDPPYRSLNAWPVASGGFYLARIIGTLTNALVILGAAALAAQLARGDSSIKSGLIWLAVSPVVMINTDFLWPKLLSSFFILLSIRASLKDNYVTAGLLATLSYLSHPLGGLFIPFIAIAIFFGSYFRETSRKAGLLSGVRRASGFCAIVILALLPWFTFKLHLGFPDVFLRYPLGDGRGFEQATSAASWLKCRASNLWISLVPTAFFFSDFVRHWLAGPVSDPLRWAIGYLKSLPGEVGLSLFPVVCLSAFRGRNSNIPRFFVLFVVAPFLFMLLFWGFSDDGLGGNCLEPLAVIAIIYATTVCSVPTVLKYLIPLCALESLSVRAFGVWFSPTFSVSAIDMTTSGLLAISFMALIAPTALLYCKSASEASRSPSSTTSKVENANSGRSRGDGKSSSSSGAGSRHSR